MKKKFPRKETLLPLIELKEALLWEDTILDIAAEKRIKKEIEIENKGRNMHILRIKGMT